MKPVNLTSQRSSALFRVLAISASLLTVIACRPQETAQEQPTSTPTLPPIATMTPVPTPTVAPTNTLAPPTGTPTPMPTATPSPVPTDTPVPPPAPTETPTATPVPLLEVGEVQVIYHDAEVVDGLARYPAGVTPWLDLLARFDGGWYGPERSEDDVEALPLPEGYRWEVQGGFAGLPNGEAWWVGPSSEGTAALVGPDGIEAYTLELRVEFY